MALLRNVTELKDSANDVSGDQHTGSVHDRHSEEAMAFRALSRLHVGKCSKGEGKSSSKLTSGIIHMFPSRLVK